MVLRNLSVLLNNTLNRINDCSLEEYKEVMSIFGCFVVALLTLCLAIYPLGLFLRDKKGMSQVPQVNRVLSWFTPFDLVYYFWKINKDGMRVFEEYVAKHGRIFRIKLIGTQHYIISDPDIVQKLLTSTDPSYRNKPSFQKTIFDIINIDGGIFGACGDKWSSRRRLLSRPFSYKSLQSYLESMNSKGKKLVEEMMTELWSTEGANPIYFGDEKLREIQDLCMMRIAASVIMGADILTEEESTAFHEHYEKAKTIAHFRVFHPWAIYDTLFRLHSKEREQFIESRAVCQGFLFKLLRIYKGQHEKLKSEGTLTQAEEDISVGLRPQRSLIEEMIHGGLSDEEILQELIIFMIGAYETTALALNALMLHIALNPKAQSKCQEEIDHLFDSDETLKSKDGQFTVDHLSNLKYLERCILENLRLAPVVPLVERRIEKPFQVDDHLVFEKGSDVIINTWSLHRDPELFEDPLKFDPDRFLPENVKTRHKGAFIPFSLGMRNCIAWKMGVMELKVVMAWLLRNFNISTRDPIQYENIRFMYNLNLKLENDINFVLKKREHS